jgi:DNA invertase Pin-like site-specific DNA recombinase
MKYGYARVSTRGQAVNGNSLDEQIEKLKAEGCEKVFQDTFTGTKAERPQFTELLFVLIS